MGNLSLALHHHKPVSLLMNTKKHLPLNDTQVERATRLFRAYKHPVRYKIIDSLLLHGQLTAAELSSFIGMDEKYILEQLDVLTQSDLVKICFEDGWAQYVANEEILIKMKNGIARLV